MKKSFLFTLSFSLFLISGGYGMAQISQTNFAADSENTDARTQAQRLPPPPPPGDFNENNNDEFPPPPPGGFDENGSEEFRQPPPPQQPAGNNNKEQGQTSDDQSRKFTKDRRDDMDGFSGRHHGRRHNRPSHIREHENRQDNV